MFCCNSLHSRDSPEAVSKCSASAECAAAPDFVSTDHYLAQHDLLNHIDLAQMADLTRGFAKGGQWLLMEHSSSAVNWQPKNFAKVPGQEKRNAMSFVARGSQGAMYFQWRQGQAGS